MAIPQLSQATDGGAALAIGARYAPREGTDVQWRRYRWLHAQVAVFLAKPLVPLQEPLAGFFALPRSLLRRCRHLSPVGSKMALEMLIKSRATNPRAIPTVLRTRRFGARKLTLTQQRPYLYRLGSLYILRFFQASARTLGMTRRLFLPLSPRPGEEVQ